MLTISNVSKTYSGSVKAVDNISIEVKPGEIVGFIGPNGAGKTSTIKMITGILPVDEGRITINGLDIMTDGLKAKKQFGYVPDSPDMFLRLKGIEYLNFFGDIYEIDSSERMSKIKALSGMFEMDTALNSKISSYSHGMRQKIVLMAVLLHNPAVWILDEPLTGLDPKSAFLLKELMRNHASEGKSVFFSTHVLEVAEKLCSKIAIINKGRIIFYGLLDELKEAHKSKSLEEIFLTITGGVEK